jgi:hypothetical protein
MWRFSLHAWVNPAAFGLAVGKTTLDVNPWQVDNALANARCPQSRSGLTLPSAAGATITCA